MAAKGKQTGRRPATKFSHLKKKLDKRKTVGKQARANSRKT